MGDLSSTSLETTVTAAEREATALVAPTSVFLNYLSTTKTRVVNDTNPAQHSNLDFLRGGCRDEPTFFTHHCRFEADGCEYATTSGLSMVFHEKVCTPESRKKFAAKAFSLPCKEEGCKHVASGDNEKAAARKLTNHKNSMHPTNPVFCNIGDFPECAIQMPNQPALARHKKNFHGPPFVAQDCKSGAVQQMFLLVDHPITTTFLPCAGNPKTNTLKALRHVAAT